MNLKHLSKGTRIAIYGLTTAIVCLATIAVQVPVPATKGYINIGDFAIFLFSVLFNTKCAIICGGIGSSLADVISGYPHWALFTLVIKGLEGLICNILASKVFNSNYKKYLKIIFCVVSMIIASIVMVIGYFLAGAFLYGSFASSLLSVPQNCIQGLVSILLATIVLFIVNIKAKIFY